MESKCRKVFMKNEILRRPFMHKLSIRNLNGAGKNFSVRFPASVEFTWDNYVSRIMW